MACNSLAVAAITGERGEGEADSTIRFVGRTVGELAMFSI